MLDSEEKVQSQLDSTATTNSNANTTLNDDFKPQNEEQKIEKKELNKRLLVEQEITNHPFFKNMQNALANTDRKLNIDLIVDRYFSLTTEVNTLENQDFYKINEDALKMSLEQTAYLISQEENGIILDETGMIDRKASLRQQAQAAYSRAIKEDLLEENLADKNDRRNKKETQEQSYSFFSYRETDVAINKLNSILNSGVTLSEDEIAQINESLSNSQEAQEEKADIKDVLFLDTIEEFRALSIILDYEQEITSEDVSSEKAAKKLQELKALKIDYLMDEKGNVDIKKSREFLRTQSQYRAEKQYSEKLEEFNTDGSDFAKLKIAEKKEMLQAIHYIMEVGTDREKAVALLAFEKISPLSMVKTGFGKATIDKERFTNLYNSLLNANEKKASYEDIAEDVRENNIQITRNQISKMEDKYEKGTFKTFDQVKNRENMTEEQRKVSTRQKVKELHEHTMAQFTKTPAQRLEHEIDRMIKKSGFKGDRAEVVVAVYYYLTEQGKTDSTAEVHGKNLAKHIKSIGSSYGDKLRSQGKKIRAVPEEFKTENEEFIKEFADKIVKFQEKQANIRKNPKSIESTVEHIKDVQYTITDMVKNTMKQFFRSRTQKKLSEGQKQYDQITNTDKTQEEIEENIENSKRTLKLMQDQKQYKYKNARKGPLSQTTKKMENKPKSVLQKVGDVVSTVGNVVGNVINSAGEIMSNQIQVGKAKGDVQPSKEVSEIVSPKNTFDEKYRSEESVPGTNKISKSFSEKQAKIASGEMEPIPVVQEVRIGEDIEFE